MEARIREMVGGMTLRQKIGQMTQPEIRSVTPAQVSEFYIGSVLNGGGSWPNGNKHARVADWLELADRYYDASLAVDSAVKIPLIWGTDAVHGHNNVVGATLFPHNIGLGAARDPDLIREIGAATARAVRATGIGWVFAPTLAVVRNDRWGRTYESFSEDGALVGRYGGAYVEGMQGHFRTDANVVATAKHFIGDGGTDQGRDQGINQSSRRDMLNLHAQGYFTALAAGVQTVMASFNSWNDVEAGTDYGKMHGAKTLLTDALKTKMGFDGFVVSDWNGIAQVSGCTNASCARAINAGIDMVMVPDDWKAFIANTVAQVESGEILMARIDDAVTRILRVKLRAGLFDKRPSQGAYAGKVEAVQARELARRAVADSLVLLKNNGGVLPLSPGKRILVVGKNADSMQNQSGGWSLTWQGTENSNADFPVGDTILAGIRAAAGSGSVVFNEKALDVDLSQFDAVIAVIGETPYAETNGDIAPPATLRHASRHPEDLEVLQAVAGKGRPVVTVFLSGRPLFVNDLLDLSDAFVAAWLPGSEGKGVSDVLFRNASGAINRDFRGKLSFSWPAGPCQDVLNVGDTDYAPLFAFGYGLKYVAPRELPPLNVRPLPDRCGSETALPIFNRSERSPYALFALTAANQRREVAVGANANAALDIPADKPVIRVQSMDINMQQDAKKLTWLGGEARVLARSGRTADLRPYADKNGFLQFDAMVFRAPAGRIALAMECGDNCGGAIDMTATFRKAVSRGKQAVKIPLACFAANGMDMSKVSVPFSLSTDMPFVMAFANVGIREGGVDEADVQACPGGLRN